MQLVNLSAAAWSEYSPSVHRSTDRSRLYLDFSFQNCLEAYSLSISSLTKNCNSHRISKVCRETIETTEIIFFPLKSLLPSIFVRLGRNLDYFLYVNKNYSSLHRSYLKREKVLNVAIWAYTPKALNVNLISLIVLETVTIYLVQLYKVKFTSQ